MVVMHAGPGRRWVEQDSRLRGVYSRIRRKLKLNKKELWQWDGGESNKEQRQQKQSRKADRKGPEA